MLHCNIHKSMSAPLRFLSSHMSPRASHRRHHGYAILASSPAVFTTAGGKSGSKVPGERQNEMTFWKKMQTCAFKNAHNSDMRIEKKRHIFTRVGLLVDPYSVQGRRNHGGKGPIAPLEDVSRGAKPPYSAHTHIHSTLIHRYFSVLTSVTCQLLRNWTYLL